MNIKSLLLGSAAAVAVVSGAQAADAIVAAEPEPMEYVRVCDAFGTGYFYIPGTETCLKIGGYVRFQVDFNDAIGVVGDADWDARTRALLNLEAKTDTELGTLGSYIAIRTWATSDYGGLSNNPATNAVSGNALEIDEAYITLGGFKVGYMYNYFDNDLSGETDDIGSNRINAIGYNYDGGAFTAGIFIDELTKTYGGSFAGSGANYDYSSSDSLGVEAQVSGAFGPVTAYLLGAYDFAAENGTVRGIVSADVGPGTFSAAALWSSGANAYYDISEWTIAAQYAAKFGKFKVTPAFQYWDGVSYDLDGDFNGGSAWRAGVTVDYQIVSGLDLKTTVNYTDVDFDAAAGVADDDAWTGFVRLQRTF
jgi:hypothetical protein